MMRRTVAIGGQKFRGILLKHPIPVRVCAEWNHATQPDFLKIALVSHEGGAAAGLGEIATVPNKNHQSVLAVLGTHRLQSPCCNPRDQFAHRQ